MKKPIFLFLIIISICSVVGTFIFTRNHKQIPSALGYGFKSKISLSVAKGEVTDFALLDHQGKFHDLYQNFDAKAIVIISQGNDCPIIQKYSSTINELKKKYESKNIVFFMINPNLNDKRPLLQKEASTYNYELPILMDPSQTITESLGITRTSEAVVIDPHGWKIIYRGAIDDRFGYGVDKQIARNNFLRDMLDSFIANKPYSQNEIVPAKGCLFSFQNPVSLSYEKVVAPIIAKKCLNCHSGSTEAAVYLPLLDSYEKLKNWTSMSRETILTDRMPPFGADLYYGEYLHNFSLTPEEKRILIKWINAGALRDGKVDPLANFKPKTNTSKLKLKTIYSATADQPTKIPPEGTIEYIFTQLGGPTPFDMWIDGAKTISTNPRQLHHAALIMTSEPLSFYTNLINIKHPERQKMVKESVDGDIPVFFITEIQEYEKKHHNKNYFRTQAWAAGKPQPHFFSKNTGIYIPKGTYLILEAHYMGSGKVETEKMTTEFYGHKVKPANFKQMYNLTLVSKEINIPPMVKDHVVYTRTVTLKNDIRMVSVLGHLHMRGKAASITLTSPEGETKTLMSFPNYYYGWQTGASVSPAEPVLLKKGSQLRGECHYDNSPQNPNNPDPTKNVVFGQRVDRTEMCKLHINFILDKTDKNED